MPDTQFKSPAKPKRTLDAVDPTTGSTVDVSSLDPNRPANAADIATGQVTQAEATLPSEPPPVEPSGKKVWYFCLDQAHNASLDDPVRLFQHDSAGCPVCPTCEKQVNAVVTEKGVVPDLKPRVAAGYGG